MQPLPPGAHKVNSTAVTGSRGMPRPIIRVKLMGRVAARTWLRQFPGREPLWGNCEFIFDHEAREYDWLVVYDDLPPRENERRSVRVERLACPQEHTLLVTSEPSSIKTYGSAYTRRFGQVLTSQPAWALPHADRIHSQPALQWFYGFGKAHEIDHDQLSAAQPWEKTRLLSTVCSKKQQRHTLHNLRYHFTEELRKLIPELDVYGHGVREMDDKAEALHDYRYHVAIENYCGLHHWTEKLADPFLGLSLPFYHGCPNATDYFPEQSFIRIDIHNARDAARIIRRAIDNNEYEKRLPFILEARRRVLDEYNLFAVLDREISLRHTRPCSDTEGGQIMSRKAANRSQPLTLLQYLYEKTRNRLRHRFIKA